MVSNNNIDLLTNNSNLCFNEDQQLYTITKIKFIKKKSIFIKLLKKVNFYFKKQMLYTILSMWYYVYCFKCRSLIYSSEICKFCGTPTHSRQKINSKNLYIRIFCSRFIVITSIFILIFIMMLSKLIFSPLLNLSFLKVGLLYSFFLVFLIAFQNYFLKKLTQKKINGLYFYIKFLFNEKFWLVYHFFLIFNYFYLLIIFTEWTLIYNLLFISFRYLNKNIGSNIMINI